MPATPDEQNTSSRRQVPSSSVTPRLDAEAFLQGSRRKSDDHDNCDNSEQVTRDSKVEKELQCD